MLTGMALGLWRLADSVTERPMPVGTRRQARPWTLEAVPVLLLTTELGLLLVIPSGLETEARVSRLRQALAVRGVSCGVVLDAAVVPIPADRLKLRAALAKAVQNALDALPEQGGRIDLRVTAGADGAEARL